MSDQDQMFDLTLTEEQRITRESIRRFAASEIREIARPADEAGAAPDGFYDKTLDLGLGLMPIPEEYGGAGVPRDPVSNVLNTEDLAWGDMSLGLGAITPLSFINAVIDAGNEAQQEKYLTQMATESFKPATIAMMEPRATFDASDIRTTARKDGDSWVIDGTKTAVIHGGSADFILVIANAGNEGPSAFIVEKGTEGLEATAEEFMGLRPVETSRLQFNSVKVPADAKLDSYDHQRFVDLCRIGTCALAVGTAEAVLDYVIPYVNERVAFGEPISYRQSVAFMVANIRIELDGMRLLTYRAASRAAQGLDFHKDAYLARVLCADKSMEIGTNGVQLLGGHGFCREHPVELWYRNLRAIGILEGTALV